MTGKTDFSPDEWETVLQGPPTAGLIVLTAQRGGTFRETVSIAKAYADARKQHGQSELLDEIVSSRPELDRTRYHSVEELREHGLQHLRSAVGLLEQKATTDEVDAYTSFVLDLAQKVAEAHREGGTTVSDAEQAALDEIASTLRSTPA
jgi:hypothetical protein